MNAGKTRVRSEIAEKYKWSIDEMYPDESSFESDINKALEMADKLSGMQGHITESAQKLLAALDTYTGAMRLIENAFTYSRMKRDENNSDTMSIQRTGRAMSAFTEISARSSFVDPEILSADPDLITSYIEEEPALRLYEHLLSVLLMQRDHTLSDKEEYILASLGEITGASGDIFTVLNNVDLRFDPVNDENGNERSLTVSSYNSFMESPERAVRQAAYESLYKGYREHINTIAAIFNNSVRKDSVGAALRNYSSCLDSKLTPQNIPLSVYDSLISAVHCHLPSFHKYIGIRSRLMDRDSISMYDMYNEIIPAVSNRYTFEEAVDIICKALKPLGDEYIEVLRNGILNEHWVDVYENEGKTSGAYSFGSYDSKPYILMNFSGRLRDVFTLIHESGHSMHSYYTRRNQPFIYGDHSIFTAEVASTVNEVLLINYLLDTTEDKMFRAYLINFYIDEFKGTLFRQTMFAEFERYAHEQSENGNTLTSEDMCSYYSQLNSDYYGPHMDTDDIIRYEWARIPHFYRAYYVYQYATGFSAANAIAGGILREFRSGTNDSAALDGYKAFLSSGSSDHPIELLKLAGVDMSTPEPVDKALEIFDSLVDELDELTEGI